MGVRALLRHTHMISMHSPTPFAALQWAALMTDVNEVASKIVALKGSYPNLDLVAVLQKYPKLLTFEVTQLKDDASKVRGHPAFFAAC